MDSGPSAKIFNFNSVIITRSYYNLEVNNQLIFAVTGLKKGYNKVNSGYSLIVISDWLWVISQRLHLKPLDCIAGEDRRNPYPEDQLG